MSGVSTDLRGCKSERTGLCEYVAMWLLEVKVLPSLGVRMRSLVACCLDVGVAKGASGTCAFQTAVQDKRDDNSRYLLEERSQSNDEAKAVEPSDCQA